MMELNITSTLPELSLIHFPCPESQKTKPLAHAPVLHHFPSNFSLFSLHRESKASMGSCSLQNVHVKLLAFDLNSLTQSHSLSSSYPISFNRKGVHVSRVEALGVVVTRDLKPDKFLRFSVDDGTGCIQCILWLNQLTSPYFSRRSPPDVRSIAQMASVHSSRVQLGHVARVRGRITSFRGSVQITVDDVVVERDPNSEILHWLECVSLARKRYDVLAVNKRQ